MRTFFYGLLFMVLIIGTVITIGFIVMNDVSIVMESCKKQNFTNYTFVDPLDGDAGYWVNCSIYKNVTRAI